MIIIALIYLYHKCLTHAGSCGHSHDGFDFLQLQSSSSGLQPHHEEPFLRLTFDVSLSFLVAYTTNFVLPLPQFWPWQAIPSDGATCITAIAIATRQKTLNILIWISKALRNKFDTTNSIWAGEVNCCIGFKWWPFIWSILVHSDSYEVRCFICLF